MTSSISSASGRSPITLGAGFLCAFIVGSLAVQLVRSQSASVQAGAAGVEPVIDGRCSAPLHSLLGGSECSSHVLRTSFSTSARLELGGCVEASHFVLGRIHLLCRTRVFAALLAIF